jgi:radical SAM superfamily enzyme YgiQ (UPF0313 family)
MNRVFQGAATVNSIIKGDLIERAAKAGLRSVFVGFESLDSSNMVRNNKRQTPGKAYQDVVNRLYDLGIMINGSFVFGLDGDSQDVFKRTVDWAVDMGITTATFHIATPYPGTVFHQKMGRADRLLTDNWDLYDTRHVTYKPLGMSPSELKAGYEWTYQEFYRWQSILKASLSHGTLKHQLKHFFYTSGWKKFEPLWPLVIHLKKLNLMTPLLEVVLSKVTSQKDKQRVEELSSIKCL